MHEWRAIAKCGRGSFDLTSGEEAKGSVIYGKQTQITTFGVDRMVDKDVLWLAIAS